MNTLLLELPYFYKYMEEDEQVFLTVDEKGLLEDFCNWVHEHYEVKGREK